MKRLVVTADDVALHRGMTLGAIRAHRHGIVTACSVAGAGPEITHAAELLTDCPALDVGVHLMLVEGRPVTPPDRVRSLVGRDGGFLAGYRPFAARYALGRVSLAEVEEELRAQIERVLEAGLTPCHLNGHQHVHVLPRVFDVVVRLAREYGIGYVRVPDDRRVPGTPLARRAAVAALGRLGRRARRRARDLRLRVNDATIGVAGAGHLDATRLRQLLTGVDGVTELVTHPGLGGAEIAASCAWRYEWDRETEALCDPSIREHLADKGIVLCGIRDLAA